MENERRGERERVVVANNSNGECNYECLAENLSVTAVPVENVGSTLFSLFRGEVQVEVAEELSENKVCGSQCWQKSFVLMKRRQRTVVSFGCLSGLECESLSDKKTGILVQKPLSATYRLLNEEVLTWLVEFELMFL
ncbi:hypothetical protein ACSQ67_022383 [Phaseolus vulgaris]